MTWQRSKRADVASPSSHVGCISATQAKVYVAAWGRDNRSVREEEKDKKKMKKRVAEGCSIYGVYSRGRGKAPPAPPRCS